MGTGAVLRIDPASGAQSLISSGNNFASSHGPIGLAIEAGGTLLVGVNAISSGPSEVLRVDPVTGPTRS